ncbi:hypothetical protein OAC51_09870 [Flavobacteriaceae bacterium]|nr:hypothetical protein [Flavobacteriaceae bacterium]
MKNKTEVDSNGRYVNVSDESLEEFRRLFLEKYHYLLSKEQALEQSLKLLNLITTLVNINVESELRKQEVITDASEYFRYDKIYKKPL